MDRNDHRTFTSAAIAFDESRIDDVVGEIRYHGRFEVNASGDGKRYDILTVLGGRMIAIANISPNSGKYIAGFGIIPERDFKDEKTRKEAEEMLAYLRNVLTFYA